MDAAIDEILIAGRPRYKGGMVLADPLAIPQSFLH